MKYILRYLFSFSFIALGIYAFPYTSVAATEPATEVTLPGTIPPRVKIFSYAPDTTSGDSTACSAPGAHTQIGGKREFIFVPSDPGQRTRVNHIYFHFHGMGDPDSYDAEKLCTDYPKFCEHVNNNQTIAIVSFTRSDKMHGGGSGHDHNSWFSRSLRTDIDCIITEAQRKLTELDIPVTGVQYSISGHSAGGKPVREWTEKASVVSFTNSIFLDASYGNWVSQTVAQANRGRTLIYFRPDIFNGSVDENGLPERSSVQKDSVRAFEADPSGSTILIAYENGSHPDVGTNCYMDHLIPFDEVNSNNRCKNVGTVVTDISLLESNILRPERLADSSIVQAAPVFDATDIEIITPRPGISIPGLSFSDTSDTGNYTVEENGTYYLSIPFLAEYIAAIFRFSIGIVSIVTILVIIVSGIQMMLPGNMLTSGKGDQKQTINQAKKRIVGSIAGLVLAMGSYTILFIVNPELVNLRALRVQFIVPELIPFDGASYTGLARNMTNSASLQSYYDAIPPVPDSWTRANYNCTVMPSPAGVMPEHLIERYECPGWTGRSLRTIPIMKEAVCRAGQIALREGYTLNLIGGYRPFQDQHDGFCPARSSFVAMPGGSNHGVGTALDVQLVKTGTGGVTSPAVSDTQCAMYTTSGSLSPGTTNPIDTQKLAEIFYEADANFVRLEFEEWHFEFGTRPGYNERGRYISQPDYCPNTTARVSSQLTGPDSLAGATGLLPGAAGESPAAAANTCTYETSAWNTVTESSVNRETISKNYTDLTEEEIETETGCSVCSEDQVPIDPSRFGFTDARPFEVCYAYKEKVETALRNIEDARDYNIREITGYRDVGRTTGAIVNDLRTKFSKHSFGTAIDINKESNALYRSCSGRFNETDAFLTSCSISSFGGAWTLTDPLSIKRSNSVYTQFTNAGFNWGGDNEGSTKDLMHFSISEDL